MNESTKKYQGDYAPGICSRCGRHVVDICCSGFVFEDGSHSDYAFCSNCCQWHGIDNFRRMCLEVSVPEFDVQTDYGVAACTKYDDGKREPAFLWRLRSDHCWLTVVVSSIRVFIVRCDNFSLKGLRGVLDKAEEVQKVLESESLKA